MGKGNKKPASAAAAGASGGGGTASASQVKLRHILCEKHGKCMEALQRVNNGERFDAVAAAMSEDAARKGGDLGWKRRTELDPAFAAVAFKLAVGEHTREPVKSAFGYHIILCEGRQA